MKTIIIIIGPDGRSMLETAGFYGSSCKDASRFIEQALGQTQGETFKPEYHLTGTDTIEQTEINT